MSSFLDDPHADDHDDQALERHERRIKRCGSCRARIVFLRTGNGKWMPVHADTVEVEDEMFDSTRHESHFATCPRARQHRKAR